MKKMTLDEIWENCLQMWKYITERKQLKASKIVALKREWILKHKPEWAGRIRYDCFFCHWDHCNHGVDCNHCPGRLVSKEFHCQRHKSYYWVYNPRGFYRKLVELNKQRRDKNGKRIS